MLEIKDPSENLFDSLREINDSQSEWLKALREIANSFEQHLEQLPSGRRKALALTHLETAVLFANKAATFGK